jgi:hypothetical protein
MEGSMIDIAASERRMEKSLFCAETELKKAKATNTTKKLYFPNVFI